jgi:hypothetical protein
VGVGKALRIYDLGKKKLLRKCENRVRVVDLDDFQVLTVDSSSSLASSTTSILRETESSYQTSKSPSTIALTRHLTTRLLSLRTIRNPDG